jgi:hypothetical protein
VTETTIIVSKIKNKFKMEEKKYLNGVFIKEKTFDNGGTQLKMSIKVQEFINELKSVEDDGWANLIISRRKEMSDKGITHYIHIDTWKPESKQDSGKMVEVASNDDLPF